MREASHVATPANSAISHARESWPASRRARQIAMILSVGVAVVSMCGCSGGSNGPQSPPASNPPAPVVAASYWWEFPEAIGYRGTATNEYPIALHCDGGSTANTVTARVESQGWKIGEKQLTTPANQSASVVVKYLWQASATTVDDPVTFELRDYVLTILDSSGAVISQRTVTIRHNLGLFPVPRSKG